MHSFNLICGLIAIPGLILVGIGRWMLIDEVRGMGTFWQIAARLPLSEPLILSRFWESAKNGAFTSLAGLVLLIPWGALQLRETESASHESRAAHLDGDGKAALYQSMLMNHEAAIQSKDEKCRKLNEYMTAWYSSLSSRREIVKNANSSHLAQFNEEAAAYTALREVTKEEQAALAALRAKKFGYSDLTNEDFDAWLKHEDEERERYQRKASGNGARYGGSAR